MGLLYFLFFAGSCFLIFLILRGKIKQFRNLASFPENNPNPVLEIDFEGNITYLNSAAKILIPEDNACGHPLIEKPLKSQAFLKGENKYSIEIEYKNRFYRENIYRLERDRRIRIYVFDITNERKENEKFRWIFNSSYDALVVVNEEGKIELTNTSCQRIFGFSSDEIVGKPIEFLIPEPFRLKHRNFCEQYFSFPKPRAMGIGRELVALRKDGSNFPVEVSLSPFGWDNKTFVLCAVRDITKRKEIDLLKDNFISAVSHKLRTPLSSLRESLSIMSEGSLAEEERKELTNLACSDAKRLENIIDSLLYYTNLCAGKEKLNIEKVNIVEVAEGAISFIKPEAEKKGIMINIHSLQDDIPFKCDRKKIFKVFVNLLDNAVKFTQGGYIDVFIDDKGDILECQISDTGVGIPRMI